MLKLHIYITSSQDSENLAEEEAKTMQKLEGGKKCCEKLLWGTAWLLYLRTLIAVAVSINKLCTV